jgi:hypothetical protein
MIPNKKMIKPMKMKKKLREKRQNHQRYLINTKLQEFKYQEDAQFVRDHLL